MITVYTRTGCQPCVATKRMLDQAGTPYTTIDADEDTNASMALMSRGIRALPFVTVTIDGMEADFWSGFQPANVKKWIGKLSGV